MFIDMNILRDNLYLHADLLVVKIFRLYKNLALKKYICLSLFYCYQYIYTSLFVKMDKILV